MRYLLDSDHISILQRRSGAEFEALALNLASHQPADIALSVVSFHEQVLGCHAYINRARTATEVVRGYRMLDLLLSKYAAVSVLPFDLAAATLFDDLRSSGIRISTMDLRIASIARAHDLIFVSRNLRDFLRVPGLEIENWTL